MITVRAATTPDQTDSLFPKRTVISPHPPGFTGPSMRGLGSCDPGKLGAPGEGGCAKGHNGWNPLPARVATARAVSLPAGLSGNRLTGRDLRDGTDPTGDRVGSAHGSRSVNPDGRRATTSLGCMRVGRSEAGSEIVVGPKLGAGSAEGRGRKDRGRSGLAAVSSAAVLLRGEREVAGCASSPARPEGRFAVRFSAGRGALTRAGVPGSRRFGSARVAPGSERSASAPGSMLAC
jgi:hypothetical protein